MSRYAGPVIDAHHHLWDLALGRHPWLTPAGPEDDMVFGSPKAIARDYLPADFQRDAARQNIVASVHIEAGFAATSAAEETRWLLSLDRSANIARRLVARVPLDRPETAAWLEAEAAHPEVVGIRDIVAWHPEPGKSFCERPGRMRDPNWRRGLAGAAELGFSFDLMLYPWQMEEALDLIRAFPHVSFILNHCGSPADRSETGLALWRDGLTALGQCPNLSLKISDPVAYDPQWTPASLRMIIDHCLSAFNSRRVMFGSDFPVAGLHAGFDDLYAVFRDAAAALSEVEQRDVFFATANRLYRLDLKDSP